MQQGHLVDTNSLSYFRRPLEVRGKWYISRYYRIRTLGFLLYFDVSTACAGDQPKYHGKLLLPDELLLLIWSVTLWINSGIDLKQADTGGDARNTGRYYKLYHMEQQNTSS